MCYIATETRQKPISYDSKKKEKIPKMKVDETDEKGDDELPGFHPRSAPLLISRLR